MVVSKDRPHGPGHSVPMLIVVECEDHSAIQAPLMHLGRYTLKRPVGAGLIFDETWSSLVEAEKETPKQ